MAIGPNRLEPSWMTLSDAMTLVLGCALAMAVPEFELFRTLLCGNGLPPLPVWAPWLWKGTDLALRADLALSAVVLFRAISWRRSLRPADWLVIGPALIVLVLAFETAGLFGVPTRIKRDLGLWSGLSAAQSLADAIAQIRYFFFCERGWRFVAGSSTAIALAIPALILVRLRRPFLATIFAIVAALGFVWGAVLGTEEAFFSVFFGDLADAYFGVDEKWRWEAYRALNEPVRFLPGGLAFAILVLASARDRGLGRPRAWTDRAGFVVGIPLIAYAASDWFYGWPRRWMDREIFLARSTGLAVWLGLLIPVAWLAIRWLGPTWRRWTAGGSDETSSA